MTSADLYDLAESLIQMARQSGDQESQDTLDLAAYLIFKLAENEYDE